MFIDPILYPTLTHCIRLPPPTPNTIEYNTQYYTPLHVASADITTGAHPPVSVKSIRNTFPSPSLVRRL
jgi:hypothetical protein